MCRNRKEVRQFDAVIIEKQAEIESKNARKTQLKRFLAEDLKVQFSEELFRKVAEEFIAHGDGKVNLKLKNGMEV